MGTLIAVLGTGKGTWLEVHGILNLRAFEDVVLFVDDWAAKDYKNEHKTTIVPLADMPLDELVKYIKEHIKHNTKAAEFDIALNIASGTGKQHAAIMTAVLQLGYGIRLVSFENGQLKVLT
jgi:hypothetical protein